MNPIGNSTEQAPAAVLTVADLSRALSIGKTRLYQAMAAGELPAPDFHIGPRQPRWLWSSVLRHLERRKACSSSSTGMGAEHAARA